MIEDSMARSLPAGFGQGRVEIPAKTQVLKSRWQGHSLQALVEPISKTQALKTRWQGHPPPCFG